MDIVITYVDGTDPQWQKSYSESVGGRPVEKRYRDWGTLKYLLRGIEKHIPFAGNVYLVVASESQVPQWVNREKLHVVLHRDIIPDQFLPTFCSSSIEMFLHRIDGLSEEFLYFNDDFFPVKDCCKEDFFVDGKPVMGFHKHRTALNSYKKRCRNSDHAAQRALGLRPGRAYMRPQHICSPMLKSQSEAVFSKLREEIYATISRLRSAQSFNQYLFLDYLYYNGMTIKGKISRKHLSPAINSAHSIAKHVVKPKTKFLCINDVRIKDKFYENLRLSVISAFEQHFPAKSSFEK